VVQGVPVVAAPEEIDITNAEALRAALLKAAASGHGMLAVDMTRTRFCDSSGLHALLAAHKRAQAEGREVRLVIPDTAAAVLRVSAITSVDRMIPNFTSLTEALAPAAAPANGRSRQRPEGEAASATSRGLAPAGQLPGTINARRRKPRTGSTARLPGPCSHTGKETMPVAPISSGRSKNAATAGSRNRPLRGQLVLRANRATETGPALRIPALHKWDWRTRPGDLSPADPGLWASARHTEDHRRGAMN
jgi:anti-sigma B factor antagonist